MHRRPYTQMEMTRLVEQVMKKSLKKGVLRRMVLRRSMII